MKTEAIPAASQKKEQKERTSPSTSSTNEGRRKRTPNIQTHIQYSKQRPMVKRFFTNGQKLRMIQIANERQENGEPVRAICRSLKIQSAQLARWRDKEDLLKASKKSCKTLNSGPPSALDKVEKPLLQWYYRMKKQQQRGERNTSIKQLHVRDFVEKVEELAKNYDPKINQQKDYKAKYEAIRRLLKAKKIRIPGQPNGCGPTVSGESSSSSSSSTTATKTKSTINNKTKGTDSSECTNGTAVAK